MPGVQVVFHTATLHKPHVATQGRQVFVDTNISGTVNLLEEAAETGVESFVFTSTTSVFGDALIPPNGAPAAWITEEIVPVPKNIYGVTKAAAEDLCQLFHRNQRLTCIILRTSRFFPEADDNQAAREAFPDENLKVNEYLFRRVDLEDVVSAHLAAAERAPEIGFGRYIISATTPFASRDLAELRMDTPSVVKRYVPDFVSEYAQRGWRMLPSIDRVYVNQKARAQLGWKPKYDFKFLVEQLKAGNDTRSPLARLVGSKGYHAEVFAEGPYPTLRE
jgi:nucleoside-diphosphate-sugar epimerase